mmetsp:Transcript_110687/g.344924  ORF Transcript_110687/g.344924 Transcript_110687/m.344924 type:complete len:377 (+) Transcript_110687:167-1297(+)
MRSAGCVSDPHFGVVLEDDCVRLRTTLEVFQYVQHKVTEKRETLGGGRDVTTRYTYTTEWSGRWHDSGCYEDHGKMNSKPPGLDHDWQVVEDCAQVEYGDAFVLPKDFVAQCNEFVSAASRLGESVRHQGGTSFGKRSDGCFYYPVDGDTTRSEAKIGDSRVRFEYVADGPASVLALQADRPGETRVGFLPYRNVSRGWCGISEDEEKLALRKAGELTPGELGEASQVGSGCLWIFCCACNMVSMCVSSAALSPEIFHLFHGSRSSTEMLGMVSATMQMTKWALRFAGWLMLFFGLYMFFSPLLALIKVIPFLGPVLAKFGGDLIWVLCFVVTLAIPYFVVCAAYLVYHPLAALLYSAIAAAVILLPITLMHCIRA